MSYNNEVAAKTETQYRKSKENIITMRKRIITILLSGMAVLAVLAGCTGKKDNGSAPAEKTPAATGTTENSSDTKIVLGQYKGLTLHEVDSEEIAKELHETMQEYAELVTVNRAAKDGDTVNINFVGKKDGVAFEGGTDDSAEGTDLTLGSGQFIEGFEAGLIGAVAGEVRDLNLTFPENYGNTDLAGQAVVFTVTVNAVKETVVPELTDEFAAENLPVNTVAGYVAALYEIRNQESFREQILAALTQTSTVENYPENIIASEKQYYVDYHLDYAEVFKSYFGLDDASALQTVGFESMEALEEAAEEYAYTTVKQVLILSEIAKVENLVLSGEEYEQRALVYAANNGYEDVASFEAEYGKDAIVEAVTLDYVIDYIVGQSTIIYDENNSNVQQAE